MRINIENTGIIDETVGSNAGLFRIPYEAACSPEFAEGCFVMEDEEDKGFD